MKPFDEQQLDEQLNIFTDDARKLFGTDEESIRKEWEAAELQWEQEKRDHPREARRIEMAADAGFEALMQRIEREKAERETADESMDEADDLIAWEEDEEREAGFEFEAEKPATRELSDEKPKVQEVETPEPETPGPEMPRPETPRSETQEAETLDTEAGEIRVDSVDEALPPEKIIPIAGKARKGRLRGKRKILLLTAVVGVMVFGMTIASTATSKYSLKQYMMPGSQSKVMNRNANLDISMDGNLKDAYEKIEKELEIPVLSLGQLPEEMRFKKLLLEGEHAILTFVYHGKRVYFEEAKMPENDGLSGMLVSDRKPSEKIYNFWLNKDIEIEENMLENGLVEYSARIELESSYYYLSGIMDKEDFISLVEQINNY